MILLRDLRPAATIVVMENFKQFHNIQNEISLETKTDNGHLFVFFKDEWARLTKTENCRIFSTRSRLSTLRSYVTNWGFQQLSVTKHSQSVSKTNKNGLGHKKRKYVSDTRTHCYVNSISRVGLRAGP